MLFDRRDKPPLSERIRVALWPRRSWGRSFRYIGKRVLRLSASPHVIAVGFAAGAAVSCTPFVGLHFILGGVLAFVLGGNILASAFGTAVGNPLTFPFLWAASYQVGQLMLGRVGDGGPPPLDFSQGVLAHSAETLLPALKPTMIGAIPVGLVIWIVFYFVVRALVGSFQEARRRRLAEHADRKAALRPETAGE